MISTQHFGPGDKMIKCPCCDQGSLSPGLLVVLEFLRFEVDGKPIIINSGARCVNHQIAIYKELSKNAGREIKPAMKSDHLIDDRGEANGADIKVNGMTPKQVYDRLIKSPMAKVLAVGLYSWGVHVGIRKYPARW